MSGPATDPVKVLSAWLLAFASAVYAGDADRVAASFLPHGWFRDDLTFTWDNRSLRGPQKIADYLADKLQVATVSNIELDDNPHLAPCFRPGTEKPLLEGTFRFATSIAHGKGYLELMLDDGGDYKALVACMALVDLKGHEEPCGEVDWEGEAGGRPWGELHAERRRRRESDPYVLIVGSGQSGLQTAARFNRMDIPTLVIEKNARVGDNWRLRYDTLALHTPKWHHQLLYQPFPSNWPLYTPRDKLSDWLESYATHQELSVWTQSSLARPPVYDRKNAKWDVYIRRNGVEVHVRPAHIIVATGTLGGPRMPALPDQDLFAGTVIHSSQYKTAGPFQGKHVVVVGAGNTSIDICQDSVIAGAKSVTMVQRSSTCVVSRHNVAAGMRNFWREGSPVEAGDFRFGCTPLGFLKEVMISRQEETWAEEKELHAKLRKGGLSLNIGPEGQGQFLLVFERCGGYWLDKGAADLIESGAIRIKQGTSPTGFTRTGVCFADNTELNADVVIFATGYVNIRETSKRIFGAEVIDRTSDVYGLDEEGELKGSYRPTGQPGLWFATGDFFHSRYMSKKLALQIKARQLGLVRDALRAAL